ncbi:YihA family ribosome biogenesis GTP-binding protein [Candidatus Epulonipiscium fishelsonii]|uniref:YihA family ribosome biogenesis GTP-binding protein n=1 Tax=Candidatus Epulonipiscium fishelsonii TaxID=77094 RepID=A0ACC8X7Z8_9FIRM|nr:YihA family ribosome biogenesis GTP-binding protein [Epulopiscium sp. SCG-B11WGA-EpuloA1]ONI39729.1 YihA family ribosome biogenesis GTP-binding protein [Epulopiscium sp. SCG-B05WGA-EpuloA1]
MRRKNLKAELIITAGNKNQFPLEKVPEIAFLGKSNVGKSSLLNTLVERKALARTSSQPGKTQTINFFNIEDKINFVDLPGYGYAKVSKTQKESWGNLIEGYLRDRNSLQQVILLIDIRHEPSQNDKTMYDWIYHYNYNVIVVATKMDKIKRSQVAKHLSVIRAGLGLKQSDKLIPFSSNTKQGKDEIWIEINNLIAEEDV